MNYLTRTSGLIFISMASMGCATRAAFATIDKNNKPFYEVSRNVTHHYESADGSKAFLENVKYSKGKVALYKCVCLFGTVPFDVIAFPVYVGIQIHDNPASRSVSSNNSAGWGELLIGLLRLIPIK